MVGHGISIANGLKRTFDASVRTIDDRVPGLEELKHMFLCNFLSDSSFHDAPFVSNYKEGSHKHDSHFSVTESLRSLLDSSSQALRSLKGLEVRVEELCKLWTERADSSRFRLSRIEWFRETVRARHEYLLIHVKNDKDATQDTQGLWLRLERRPTHALERRRDYVTRLLGHFEADDVVTISRHKADLLHQDNVDSKPQDTMTFNANEPRLSLRYVLEVLKIIHEESHEYHIAGANCWFFAATIVEALLQRAGQQIKLASCDHRKTKEFVNGVQYRHIMERITGLSNIEW